MAKKRSAAKRRSAKQHSPLEEAARLRKRLERELRRAAAKPIHYRTKEGWQLVRNQRLNVTGLKRWMREMGHWGKLVRQDILRLEECCGLPPGDPGDPPPPPAM